MKSQDDITILCTQSVLSFMTVSIAVPLPLLINHPIIAITTVFRGKSFESVWFLAMEQGLRKKVLWM